MAKRVAYSCINPKCSAQTTYENEYCMECALIIAEEKKQAESMRRVKVALTEYDRWFLSSIGMTWL